MRVLVSLTLNHCILWDSAMSVVSDFNMAVLSSSWFFCLRQHTESLVRNSPCICSMENKRVCTQSHICSSPSFQGNKRLLLCLQRWTDESLSTCYKPWFWVKFQCRVEKNVNVCHFCLANPNAVRAGSRAVGIGWFISPLFSPELSVKYCQWQPTPHCTCVWMASHHFHQ